MQYVNHEAFKKLAQRPSERAVKGVSDPRQMYSGEIAWRTEKKNLLLNQRAHFISLARWVMLGRYWETLCQELNGCNKQTSSFFTPSSSIKWVSSATSSLTFDIMSYLITAAIREVNLQLRKNFDIMSPHSINIVCLRKSEGNRTHGIPKESVCPERTKTGPFLI